MAHYVLMGEENQKEMAELVKCPHIKSMMIDLVSIGETVESLRKASRFTVLNNRYKTLSGKTCRRLGAVLDAILAIYPKESL